MIYVPPHLSVFIAEEMDARGWSRDILAWTMVLGSGKRDKVLAALAAVDYAAACKEWQITRLALDFYFSVGPTEPGLRMGEMAEKFSLAFGTSRDFFRNLEIAWLREASSAVSQKEK